MAGDSDLTYKYSSKVLMYHGICSKTSQSPANREEGAELYDVTIENFMAQMTWLKEQGYSTDEGDSISHDKKIVITFDDGEINNFQEAFPLLKKLGFTAYFFIIVKRIGLNGYMGWEEIKQIIGSGMQIGSHGLTHSILTNLKETQLEEELKDSKRNLEINLKRSIEDFSIPRGFCNDKVIEKAYQAGYKRVFVSEKPYQVKADCVSRIAIKRNWTLERFKRNVSGHMATSESLSNFLKSTAKILLTESGYSWLRNNMIRLMP
jgi:peptidoglycan/xylan/chitin deacetylase (PgdA/CDA1 family)